jgi:hypothetical protein
MDKRFTRDEAYAITVICGGEEIAAKVFKDLADDYIFYADADGEGFFAASDTDPLSGWDMNKYIYVHDPKDILFYSKD